MGGHVLGWDAVRGEWVDLTTAVRDTPDMDGVTYLVVMPEMRAGRVMYMPGDRIDAYCQQCARVTSHMVTDQRGTAVCTESHSGQKERRR